MRNRSVSRLLRDHFLIQNPRASSHESRSVILVDPRHDVFKIQKHKVNCPLKGQMTKKRKGGEKMGIGD